MKIAVDRSLILLDLYVCCRGMVNCKHSYRAWDWLGFWLQIMIPLALSVVGAWVQYTYGCICYPLARSVDCILSTSDLCIRGRII